jgi:hypothetical protein
MADVSQPGTPEEILSAGAAGGGDLEAFAPLAGRRVWPGPDLPGRTALFVKTESRCCPRGQHRRRNRMAVSAVKGDASGGHHSPVLSNSGRRH